MALSAGTRLGHFEIETLLGAGGMGEVYRARDARLDRTVAVKVLAPELATDPTFRARFETEAKTISAITHPHICRLYDIGRERPDRVFDTRTPRGRDLAARLERGPLPLRQVLGFGVEIADALEAAHRQGIVHRDLKPANVMITPGGTKLLDFGLAKNTVGGVAGSPCHSSRLRQGRPRLRARSSARCRTWRPNRCRASRPTCAPTSSRWARAVRDGHRPARVRGYDTGEPHCQDSRNGTSYGVVARATHSACP